MGGNRKMAMKGTTMVRRDLSKTIASDNNFVVDFNSRKQNIFQFRNNLNDDLYVNYKGIVDVNTFEIKLYLPSRHD